MGTGEIDMSTVGPLARGAADLGLVLDVLAGPDEPMATAWQLRLPPPRHDDLAGYRIGAWLQDADCPVATEVVDLLTQAVGSLREAGATVDEVRPVALRESARLFQRLCQPTMSMAFPDELYAELRQLAASDERSQHAQWARHVTASYRDVGLADQRRQGIQAQWHELFRDYDAVLCPITPTAALPHDQSDGDRTITVDGVARDYWSQVRWSQAISIAHLPVAAVPVGLTREGLPVGIQVVGPFLQDRTVVDLAARLEAAHGGFAPRRDTDGVGAAGLIGRDAALEVLDDAVAAARSGRGRLLLVSGDAGIGKTALAAELLHRAARPGTVTVWAACSPGLGAPAYWPWVQALRGVARQVPGHPLPGPLARLTGDLQHGVELPDPGRADRARFQLFDALAGYFTEVARAVPLVLIIDDLHWADEPSLLAGQFVAERLPSAGILLVGTYRDVEAGPALREMARGAQLLSLRGLDQAGIGELMARVHRASGGEAISEEVARAVWQRTGGNPFFARELTRLLPADRGAAPGIPEGVRDILARRLELLSTECRTLLGYAALLGSPFEADVLAQLHGGSHGRTVDLLEQASAHRIVLRLPGPAAHYRFVHDLFRETVAHSLGGAEREGHHLALARVLIDRAAHGRPVPAARIAEQLCAAGLPAAPDAVRFALRAAAEATSQLAYEDACDHLERARAAAESSEDVQASDHLEVLIRLGDASHAAGRADASREALLAGSMLARHVGDPVATARCALGLHRLGVRAGFQDPATTALLDEAAAALPESALSWRAQVLAAIVRHRHHHRLRQDALGTELAERALALARAHGDPGVLATCLLAAHDAAWSPASAAARLPIVEEMLDAADQAGDADLRAQAAQLRAAILLELGDPEGPAALTAYCREAEQLGYPRARWNAVTRRATLATITGSVREATELLRAGLVLGQQVGEPDAGGVAATQALTLQWLAHLTRRVRGVPPYPGGLPSQR